jgi:hypothetical protein
MTKRYFLVYLNSWLLAELPAFFSSSVPIFPTKMSQVVVDPCVQDSQTYNVKESRILSSEQCFVRTIQFLYFLVCHIYNVQYFTLWIVCLVFAMQYIWEKLIRLCFTMHCCKHKPWLNYENCHSVVELDKVFKFDYTFNRISVSSLICA